MTRYRDTDLSKMEAPDAIQHVTHKGRLTERLSDLTEEMEAEGIAFDVQDSADPQVIAQRTGATYDVVMTAAVNDAVKAVMLATSWGNNLDHLGAGRRTPRLTAKAGNLETGIPAVMEDQERYRRRIQLAPDTWAAEGPLSSYEYFGLDTEPMAQDIAVYDFRHGIGLKRGHILVVVLPFAGDDPETVRKAVRTRLLDPDVAPGGKLVEVVLAKQLQIQGAARLLTGRDPGEVKARAEANLKSFFESVRRFAPVFSHSQLTKALQVEGVQSVIDVTPGGDIALDHRTVPVLGSFDLKTGVAK